MLTDAFFAYSLFAKRVVHKTYRNVFTFFVITSAP